MKNVLKIWLVDNTVTVDNKDDKIGQLESSGNLSLQDILDEMHKEDTGLRPETIEHVVKLYNRVVSDLILSGYSQHRSLPRRSATPRCYRWRKMESRKELRLRLLHPRQRTA